jgi:hypothetical protein
MKELAMACLALTAGAFAQNHGKYLSSERGQVPIQTPELSRKTSPQQGPTQWTGLLLDAGCPDRSLENLLAPPAVALAVEPPSTKPTGISVSPRVLKAERAEATLPDTLDHASRYPSASCAITADTFAFALLVPDGRSWRLLNLDEGGNTLALEAFQAAPAGRQILNGKTGGLKPYASVKGVREGDKLKAQSVELTTPH